MIDAAIEVIAKHGISGTAMAAVPRFDGLSNGLVNFHFKTKQSMFEETLRLVVEEHRRQWKKSVRRASLAPADRLLVIVDTHDHPKICNRKKLAVWFGFHGEVVHRAIYRDLMTELIGGGYGGIHAGHLPSGSVLVYDEDGYCMGGPISEKLRATGQTVTPTTPADNVSPWTKMTGAHWRIRTHLMKLGGKLVQSHVLEMFEAATAHPPFHFR